MFIGQKHRKQEWQLVHRDNTSLPLSFEIIFLKLITENVHLLPYLINAPL